MGGLKMVLVHTYKQTRLTKPIYVDKEVEAWAALLVQIVYRLYWLLHHEIWREGEMMV